MHPLEIRAQSPFAEIDYLRLKSILSEYTQPRNKIRTLLKNHSLIRVKKGLYVFGEKVAQGLYCKEHLANLIYGPSAISREYALSFYGLIPERVEEITNITPKRNKIFDTPVGRFSYQYIPIALYPYGITQTVIEGRKILIATPEKALCDILYLSSSSLNTEKELDEYLAEDLRIDIDELLKFDVKLLRQLDSQYKNKNINLLINTLGRKDNARRH